MATKKSSSTKSVSKTPHFIKKEAIDFGFGVAKSNIFFFLSLFVVIIITYGFLGVLESAFSGQSAFLSFLAEIVRVVVGLIISMGVIKVALEFVDKRKPQLKDVFYTKSILNYFLVSIIKSIIIVAGLVLFIIPGIIFSIKLQFATYLVVDKNMGVVDALNKSWEMTKGVKMNLFLFGIILALINLVGLCALVVGLLLTIPLSMVATAYVYRKLLA